MSGHEFTEPLLNRVEHGIRCYDPCLSCSTHAYGKMPLHLRLIRRGPDSYLARNRPRMTPAPILVIGFGNTLRSDDGAGPHIAPETIGRLGLLGVQTLTLHQLSPEHAEPVSRAGTVIFVDAAVGGPDAIQVRPVAPRDTYRLAGHTAEPATLLALARDIYGHAPVAWLVTLPRTIDGLGEHLDPVTENRVTEAVARGLRASGREELKARFNFDGRPHAKSLSLCFRLAGRGSKDPRLQKPPSLLSLIDF